MRAGVNEAAGGGVGGGQRGGRWLVRVLVKRRPVAICVVVQGRVRWVFSLLRAVQVAGWPRCRRLPARPTPSSALRPTIWTPLATTSPRSRSARQTPTRVVVHREAGGDMARRQGERRSQGVWSRSTRCYFGVLYRDPWSPGRPDDGRTDVTSGTAQSVGWRIGARAAACRRAACVGDSVRAARGRGGAQASSDGRRVAARVRADGGVWAGGVWAGGRRRCLHVCVLVSRKRLCLASAGLLRGRRWTGWRRYWGCPASGRGPTLSMNAQPSGAANPHPPAASPLRVRRSWTVELTNEAVVQRESSACGGPRPRSSRVRRWPGILRVRGGPGADQVWASVSLGVFRVRRVSERLHRERRLVERRGAIAHGPAVQAPLLREIRCFT